MFLSCSSNTGVKIMSFQYPKEILFYSENIDPLTSGMFFVLSETRQSEANNLSGLGSKLYETCSCWEWKCVNAFSFFEKQ